MLLHYKDQVSILAETKIKKKKNQNLFLFSLEETWLLGREWCFA